MVNLQLVRYFETVARLEHFTQAANELYITQPTLSKAIETLEEEMGVKLFEKKGRNVKLTFYGKILRDYIQRGIKEIDDGVNTVKNLASENSGTVRIEAIYSAGSLLLPKYMKGFSDEHPDIKLKFFQKPTYRILDDLAEGNIDIGFCTNFEMNENYNSICREPIMTEEICLIVPKDHRLAGKECVDFTELIDETWIGYNSDTGMATAIMNTARSATDKKLKFSYYASEDSAIVGLVRNGLGIGMITESDSINMAGVDKIHITSPCFFRTIYMVWNQEQQLSPPAKAFRRYILSVS